MNEEQTLSDARTLTAEIVAAYVANNNMRGDDLAQLITSVYGALRNIGQPKAGPVAQPLVPPVSVKRSIHNDYLISMEDGKQYQSLKRHLSKHGLTPADYRTKWSLPSDYPMVAPGYSERRSALAKSLGLGQLRGKRDAAEKVEAEAVEKPKRGRKKDAAAEPTE